MKEKAKKQIFVLFRCDVWKSKSSMSMCGATTSATKLKRMVISEIKAKNLVFGDEEDSISAQVKAFREAFKKESPLEINNQLVYGYIESANDGEVD